MRFPSRTGKEVSSSIVRAHGDSVTHILAMVTFESRLERWRGSSWLMAHGCNVVYQTELCRKILGSFMMKTATDVVLIYTREEA